MPAVVLSGVQVATLGRITPLVLAVDVAAGTMLPFGLLSLELAREGETGPGQGHGDDGGGRRPDCAGPRPLPAGGLILDWERFEAEFRAYAREQELAG